MAKFFRIRTYKKGGEGLIVCVLLNKKEFLLSDVYAHAGALAKLHPNNAHVRDKIRQQKKSMPGSPRKQSGESPQTGAKPGATCKAKT